MTKDDLRTFVEGREQAFLSLGKGDICEHGTCWGAVALLMDDIPKIAEWEEDSDGGTTAWAFRFPDETVFLMSDYFGSCPGCDAFQACDSGEELYDTVRTLAHNGTLHKSVAEARKYIDGLKGEYGLTEALRELAKLMPEQE